MTVSELIEELSKYPPDTPVVRPYGRDNYKLCEPGMIARKRTLYRDKDALFWEADCKDEDDIAVQAVSFW